MMRRWLTLAISLAGLAGAVGFTVLSGPITAQTALGSGLDSRFANAPEAQRALERAERRAAQAQQRAAEVAEATATLNSYGLTAVSAAELDALKTRCRQAAEAVAVRQPTADDAERWLHAGAVRTGTEARTHAAAHDLGWFT